MISLTIKVGRRGTVVVPAELRREYGLEEGSLIIAEGRADGVLLRPAKAVPIEIYPPERRAEFLLTNAVDADDYRQAVAEVRKMGYDPSEIAHTPPADSDT